jgi:hypothetical protein
MTEPQDSTRPISVAELLAKNGTIGAPPVGGRRRRRRGNADSVTVAELTGEMPIIRAADVAPREHVIEHPAAEPAEPAEALEPADTEAPAEPEEPIEAEQEPAALVPEAADEEFAVLAEAETEAEAEVDETAGDETEVDDTAGDDTAVDDTAGDDTAVDEAEADYAAHLEQRDSDPEPIEFTPPPRRAAAASPTGFSAGGGAEQMSPDPLFDDDESPSDDDIQLDLAEIASGAAEFKQSKGFEPSPSLLRSNSDTLFGGQSVADDLARRGQRPGPEDIDLGDEEYDDETTKISTESVSESTGSAFLRGVWVVAQCILAVAFGAGLFIAFDQLWKWNNIVALVLSVLVILGLVVGVRVVRKTEDIGSTLIAVAVGALVTLGPLALLQSH